MMLHSGRKIRCALAIMTLCLMANSGAHGQASKTGADQKPQMSEDAFKNVQVLRGLHK